MPIGDPTTIRTMAPGRPKLEGGAEGKVEKGKGVEVAGRMAEEGVEAEADSEVEGGAEPPEEVVPCPRSPHRSPRR